jgi:uncharacterized protein YndB with AHSA1/START domain
MKEIDLQVLTVAIEVNAPVEKTWNFWTSPVHITKWNQASADWHTPYAENDLRTGGNFRYRMEAKDKSYGFDFGGVYNEVRNHEYIEYTIGDGRKVKITFTAIGNSTKITETFESESINSRELQRKGWQAILDSFSIYVEEN